MSIPKISIVTPSLDQAQFLEQTLRSVLDQKYQNLEYVVVDGGSTDGSVEIINQYAPQLAYWVSEPDSGHGNALNKGFKRSTGEIMAWLNSDDLYFPWTLRTVAEIFAAHPDIDWITSHANAILDQNGRIVSAGSNSFLRPLIYKEINSFVGNGFKAGRQSHKLVVGRPPHAFWL